MSNNNQKPEMTLSDGAMKAALWKREGPNAPYYAATFSKTYRDDQDNYQNTHSFSGADLLKLSELARQAYQESRELQLRDRQAEQRNNRRHDKSMDRER